MQWTIGKAVAVALTGGIMAGGAAVAALAHGDNGEAVARMLRPSIEAAAADGFDVEPGTAGAGLAALPPGALPSTTTAPGSVLVPASSTDATADSSTTLTTAVPASSTTATLPSAGSTTTAAATTTTATVPPSTATTDLVPATVAPSTSTTAGTVCQPLDTSASA